MCMFMVYSCSCSWCGHVHGSWCIRVHVFVFMYSCSWCMMDGMGCGSVCSRCGAVFARGCRAAASRAATPRPRKQINKHKTQKIWYRCSPAFMLCDAQPLPHVTLCGTHPLPHVTLCKPEPLPHVTLCATQPVPYVTLSETQPLPKLESSNKQMTKQANTQKM